MRPRPVLPSLLVSLLAACAGGADVDARLADLGGRVDEDVLLAHGCADELRSIAAQDEVAVGTALGVLVGTGPLGAPHPWPSAPPRSAGRLARDEIVRSERAVTGSRSALAAARAVGPAALYQAVTAEGVAREERRKLCRARDAALRLAGTFAPPAAAGGTAVLAR